MTELGPAREDRPGNEPAPAVYQWTHGDWLWCVHNHGTSYDVYAYSDPAKTGHTSRLFKGSYFFRYFAKRRCRKGN